MTITYSMLGRQWLRRAKPAWLANMNLETSPESDIPRTQSRLVWSPSSGSLVYPSPMLIPLNNIFEDRYSGNANAVRPDNTEAQEENRDLTQWHEDINVLGHLPRIVSYQLPVLDESTPPTTPITPPFHGYHNEFTFPSGDLTIGLFNQTDTSSVASHHPSPHIQTADARFWETLLAPDPMGFSGIGAASCVDGLGDSYNFIPQSTNNQDNRPCIMLGSAWQPYPAFALDAAPPPPLNGASLEIAPEFTRSNALNDGVLEDHQPEPGENESDANRACHAALAGRKDKFEERNTKIVKIFPCIHDGCPFTARCRKDARRHLQSDKHRNDTAHDRFYCKVPACKFASEGFSRRDNLLRHMSNMHHIELDREKRGRKRNREE